MMFKLWYYQDEGRVKGRYKRLLTDIKEKCGMI
jgi:hypothetical protein